VPEVRALEVKGEPPNKRNVEVEAAGENSVYTAGGKKVVHKASFKLSSKSAGEKLRLLYKW
jgi:hypothetical protein